MKAQSFTRTALALSLLLTAALACNLPSAATTATIAPAVTQTLSAPATMSAGTLQSPPATAVPPEATPVPATAEPATATPVPTIVHALIPGGPGAVDSYVTDRSSAALASQRRTIADYFDLSQFERPLTAQVMDYQPYLDITRAELSAVEPWIYVTIYLEGQPPAEGQASYAVEIDLNLDGRGEWLITAALPLTTTWTTEGVRAYRDANHDVGGPNPLRADPAPQPTDGYESLVFDQGLGPDPDAAWARISPSNPAHIQLAFKHALIAMDTELLWGAWADGGPQSPAWFDYNDHFSIDEAGSPIQGNTHYPLQALASVDNTCRWGYDFTPTGDEPGVCQIPPTPTPVPTPTSPPTPTSTRYIIY
jgi:hypothetical protein